MANLSVWLPPVLVFLVLSGHGSSVIVEKRQSTNISCSFPSNVTSISWKLLTINPPVDLSTCDFVSAKCTDQMPSLYKGTIVSSSSNKVMGLDVLSARVNETSFQCIANTGEISNVTELVVYAWPTKPTCRQTLTTTFVEYNCTTENVYPGISATLHRREVDFSHRHIDNSSCRLDGDGSGTDGDDAASCTWRIVMANMFVNTSVFVEMTPYGFNSSVVHRSPAVSEDIRTTLSVPTVILTNCPAGLGVRGNYVPRGIVAKCTCEIASQGFPPGFARWYTKDKALGVENTIDKSSTLSFSYNSSDPHQVYECWPITPLKAIVYIKTISFNFDSSAPPSGITGIQLIVVILGALTSWIVSRFS